MGKRFGRNQKRRLKAELAAAEYQRDRLARDLEHARLLHRAHEEAVNATAEALGDYLYTLPVRSCEIRHLDEIADGWRMTKMARLPSEPLRGVDPISVKTAMEIVDLEVAQGSSAFDHLMDRQHLRFTMGKRVVGYGLSRRALEELSREELARKVGEEVAQVMFTGGVQS